MNMSLMPNDSLFCLSHNAACSLNGQKYVVSRNGATLSAKQNLQGPHKLKIDIIFDKFQLAWTLDAFGVS